MNGEFALVAVTHKRATGSQTLTVGAAEGKHKRRSAPGESCVDRFSDAGSTPAVSSLKHTYEPRIRWFGHVFQIKIRLPEGY